MDALTAVDKEKVRHWIEIGAPSDQPVVVAAVETAPAAVAETVVPVVEPHSKRAAEPLWKRTLRWVGKFQPFAACPLQIPSCDYGARERTATGLF